VAAGVRGEVGIQTDCHKQGREWGPAWGILWDGAVLCKG